MRRFKKTGGFAVIAAAALVLSACSAGGDGGNTDTPAAQKDGGYVIGVSNTLAGNGWREEAICSVKAEALANGKVDKVIAISKNGGPTEQIQDLQSLISQGVDAIVLLPADLEKLNPIIEEATKQGIVVVAVDSPVTAESAYVAVNDQVTWGALGAQFLADEMGGKGEILYMRGIDGVPADTERDQGFTTVLAKYPDITYKTVWTGWDYTKGGEIAVQELTAGNYQGIWTSGADYTVVNAFATVGVPPVPVTGQETNAFIGQLIDGKPGAVITNPAIIGGVGANIALRVLNGDKVDKMTMLTPTVLDAKNNMDALKTAYSADRDALYNATLTLPGQTTFTPEQLLACKGPGE